MVPQPTRSNVVDMLQSAEVVAAVLCRTDGGEQYERLLGFAGTTGVGGKDGGAAVAGAGADADSDTPIHGDWDR